ncbi:MAG: SseB family protein [Acetatifactor sp.]
MSDMREKKFAALQEIAAAEEIFFTCSSLTRLPYFTLDGATQKNMIDVYLSKEACENQAKELTDEKKPAFAMRVVKNACLIFFSDLYSYGVDVIRYHGAEEDCELAPNEVVTRTIPEGKMTPLENASLEAALIYYMQEARRPMKFQNTMMRDKYAARAVQEIVRAKFLLPIAQKEEGGEVSRSAITVKVVNGKLDVKAIPIFSDAVEYQRALGDKGFQPGTTDMLSLMHMPLPEGCAGYVINPTSTSMVVPEELLSHWRELAQKGKLFK